MEVVNLLLDKLDALGVLVVVVTYVLIRERNNKKKVVGNPNGIIKALENLTTETREHNKDSSERMVQMLERIDNMGTNLTALFLQVNETKVACGKILERVRGGNLK